MQELDAALGWAQTYPSQPVRIIMGHAGNAPDIIARFPKMRTRIADGGPAVLFGSPADLGKLIAEETE